MVSSNAYMWFGIPGKAMQWVPAPKAGFQRNWMPNVDALVLQDGRQAIRVSSQKRSQFVGDYFGDYTNPDGVNIDVFNSYAAGYYGVGPIIFANPYSFQRNMFSPHWATPALVEHGWAPVTDVDLDNPVGYGDVDASLGYGRPGRYALYSINTSPYSASGSANQFNQYIAIPPGYTLHVGATCGYGGSGVIIVQPFLASNNQADVVTVLDPIPYDTPTQMNASFDGDTYNAVRVYLSRTNDQDSTVLLFSMMAQLWPTGSTGVELEQAHKPGQGCLGLAIVGSALAETYNYGGIQKGLNLTLEETIR